MVQSLTDWLKQSRLIVVVRRVWEELTTPEW